MRRLKNLLMQQRQQFKNVELSMGTVAYIRGKAIPLQTWTALRVPGGSGFLIYRQSAHEGNKIVSPTHQLPLLLRKYSWYSFLLMAELILGP
jgi:hypothetical protein